MKRIPLTQGKFALVDDEDFEWLSQYKWHLSHYGYAVCNEYLGGYRSRGLRMHRLVMGAPHDMVVDHINHDKLDNQKNNLRICKSRQNQYNMKRRKDNTSGFKGVRWHQNKWNARIYVSGKETNLGSFDDKLEAAKAYNRAARKHYGDFALLNTIGEISW